MPPGIGYLNTSIFFYGDPSAFLRSAGLNFNVPMAGFG